MLNNFSPPENRAVYVIMWKKHVTTKRVTDDNVIRRRKDAILHAG
jgi:hypothetical protein